MIRRQLEIYRAIAPNDINEGLPVTVRLSFLGSLPNKNSLSGPLASNRCVLLKKVSFFRVKKDLEIFPG